MSMALKMSTDVLLSCWVCSPEGKNHCSKAGVNVPLLQRQLSLKLENQGHWYLQGNKDIIITIPIGRWPSIPQACPTPLAGTSPGSYRLSSVSQTDQIEEQPTHTPFESVLNLSTTLLLLTQILQPRGPLNPPQREAHAGQVGSEQLRRRIYASSHLCLPWSLLQSVFEALSITSQLLAKSAIITSVIGADFSRPLEANNNDSQLHYSVWNVESRSLIKWVQKNKNSYKLTFERSG